MEALGYLFLLVVLIFLGIRFLVAHSKAIFRGLGILGWFILGIGGFLFLWVYTIPGAFGWGILAIALYPFRKKE